MQHPGFSPGAVRFDKPRATKPEPTSQHGPEMVISRPLKFDIMPGQNGCAARDSNPEPAD